MLVLELVPHGADELGDGDGVRVVADETQHEDAILSEVLLDEMTQQFLVGIAVQLAHEVEVLLDVAEPIRAEHRSQGPGDKTGDGHRSDEDHPEPEEQIDLLVEQVDRQHTLHRVALHVAETPHLQIAHGDPGEATRLSPIFPTVQLLEDIDAVHVVVRPEEPVQQEQLADDVRDEQDLHPEVERYQVVAPSTTARRAERSGQDVLQADGTAALGFVLARQVSEQHNEQMLLCNRNR